MNNPSLYCLISRFLVMDSFTNKTEVNELVNVIYKRLFTEKYYVFGHDCLFCEFREQLIRIAPYKCIIPFNEMMIINFTNSTRIKSEISDVILNQYVLLKNMTLDDWQKIIHNVLTCSDHKIVDNFFFHFTKMFNLIYQNLEFMLSTNQTQQEHLLYNLNFIFGLLDELENPSMLNLKFLSSFKIILNNVLTTNIHTNIVSNVIKTIDYIMVQCCFQRDELIRKNSIMLPDTMCLFSEIWKHDISDSYCVDNQKLKNCGHSIIYIKYNCNEQINRRNFLKNQYDILENQNYLEIYKKITSIVICDKTDLGAIEFVLDPHGQGLLNVIKFIIWLDDGIALSDTHIIKILFGFFSTQFSKYKAIPSHQIIKNTIYKLIKTSLNPMIMSNLTYMDHCSNSAYEWLKILIDVSRKINIKINFRPSDESLWTQCEDYFEINQNALYDVFCKSNALRIYHTILEEIVRKKLHSVLIHISFFQIAKNIPNITTETLYIIYKFSTSSRFFTMNKNDQDNYVKTLQLHPMDANFMTINTSYFSSSLIDKIIVKNDPIEHDPIKKKSNDWTTWNDPLSIGISLAEYSFSKSDFTCPISQQICEDPVFYGGHIYDRIYLEQWFETNPEKICPHTRSNRDENGPLQIVEPSVFFIKELEKYKCTNQDD